jgi:hypothetical protein
LTLGCGCRGYGTSILFAWWTRNLSGEVFRVDENESD